MLDDANPDRERVERLVLCQGKIYYDIAGHEQRADATGVAVARIEQLYPFPTERAQAVLRAATRTSARSCGRRRSRRTWARGARSGTGWRRRSRTGVPLLYVGRPWRASPSEGYPTAHLREQDRIVRAALGL